MGWDGVNSSTVQIKPGEYFRLIDLESAPGRILFGYKMSSGYPIDDANWRIRRDLQIIQNFLPKEGGVTFTQRMDYRQPSEWQIRFELRLDHEKTQTFKSIEKIFLEIGFVGFER